MVFFCSNMTIYDILMGVLFKNRTLWQWGRWICQYKTCKKTILILYLSNRRHFGVHFCSSHIWKVQPKLNLFGNLDTNRLKIGGGCWKCWGYMTVWMFQQTGGGGHNLIIMTLGGWGGASFPPTKKKQYDIIYVQPQIFIWNRISE